MKTVRTVGAVDVTNTSDPAARETSAPRSGSHTLQASHVGSARTAGLKAFYVPEAAFHNPSTTVRSLSDFIASPPVEHNRFCDVPATIRSSGRGSRDKIQKKQNPVGFRCYFDRYNCRWLIRFNDDGRDRLMLRSRFLMECRLGRPLEKREQVRHRDFDSRNDAPTNLFVFELSDLGPLQYPANGSASREDVT